MYWDFLLAIGKFCNCWFSINLGLVPNLSWTWKLFGNSLYLTQIPTTGSLADYSDFLALYFIVYSITPFIFLIPESKQLYYNIMHYLKLNSSVYMTWTLTSFMIPVTWLLVLGWFKQHQFLIWFTATQYFPIKCYTNLGVNFFEVKSWTFTLN